MSYGGLAVDASDYIVLTGSFEGVLDCGGGALTSAGGKDAFVAKLDPLGNHVWSARFGDADDQEGKGVAVDASGSLFVTGEFSGAIDFGTGVHVSTGDADIFVARLAP